MNKEKIKQESSKFITANKILIKEYAKYKKGLKQYCRKAIGERITKLREANGLSVQDLAAIIQCAPIVISTWERGKSSPSVINLIIIASFFEVTTDYLLGVD